MRLFLMQLMAIMKSKPDMLNLSGWTPCIAFAMIGPILVARVKSCADR